MAISKEALATLLATQLNNPEITADFITDEMLAGLEIEEEETLPNPEEEEVEDEQEEQDEEETDETEDENEDEEETDPFADVDPDKLSPTERMFYDYVVSEKEKAKKREISLLIQGSQISIQHKMVLDRMAKEGMSISAIEKTIADFKQIEASSARVGGTTKIISRSKTKGSTTTKKKDDVPKIGTKEFGAYLAKLKKDKKY